MGKVCKITNLNHFLNKVFFWGWIPFQRWVRKLETGRSLKLMAPGDPCELPALRHHFASTVSSPVAYWSQQGQAYKLALGWPNPMKMNMKWWIPSTDFDFWIWFNKINIKHPSTNRNFAAKRLWWCLISVEFWMEASSDVSARLSVEAFIWISWFNAEDGFKSFQINTCASQKKASSLFLGGKKQNIYVMYYMSIDNLCAIIHV